MLTGANSRPDLLILVGKEGRDAPIVRFPRSRRGEIRGERLARVGHTLPVEALEAQRGQHHDRTSLKPEPHELPEVILFLPSEVDLLWVGDVGIPVPHALEVLSNVFKMRMLHLFVGENERGDDAIAQGPDPQGAPRGRLP